MATMSSSAGGDRLVPGVPASRSCVRVAATTTTRRARRPPDRRAPARTPTRRGCCRSRRTRSRSRLRRPSARSSALRRFAASAAGSSVAFDRDQPTGDDGEGHADECCGRGALPGDEAPDDGDDRADHRGHRRDQPGPADCEALVEATERGDVEHAAERAEREVTRSCGHPPRTATTTAPASAHSCAVTSTASVRARVEARPPRKSPLPNDAATTNPSKSDIVFLCDGGAGHYTPAGTRGSWPWRCSSSPTRARRRAHARRPAAACRTGEFPGGGRGRHAPTTSTASSARSRRSAAHLGRWPVLGSSRWRARVRASSCRCRGSRSSRGARASRARAALPEREWNGPVRGWQEIYRDGIAALGRRPRSRRAAGARSSCCSSTPARPRYGAPEYGGNRELAGWRAIGYAGDVQPARLERRGGHRCLSSTSS